MRKRPLTYFLLLIAACITSSAFAQSSNSTLFSIGEEEVQLDEFEYIFTKNNRDPSAHTEQQIRDYLDLYINFKYKVRAAKDMQLDTLEELQQELAGYRNQLTRNFLLDKKVEESLAREVYERKQEDLKIAHILIRTAERSDEEAQKLAKSILDSIENQDRDFFEMATRHSEDPSVENNRGQLGYLTALFPSGFEDFEDRAYQMEVGEVAGPVPSKAGYHIVQLMNRRPARGTIELSHIFVRIPEDASPTKKQQAEEKIQEAYRQLKEGDQFRKVALKYSDDGNTKRKGGFLGEVKAGTYEESIEDVAFSLEEQGDYSQPVRSSLGWHILKRGTIQKPQDRSFRESKKSIISELRGTSRIENARKALIQKVKDEAPLTVKREVLATLRSQLDSSFTKLKWNIPELEDDPVVFQFGKNIHKKASDVLRFMKKSTRERMRLDQRVDAQEAFDILFKQYLDEVALEFEQSRLSEKYPEFRHLMREYEEGILLFEVTRRKVWDKAQQDTAGLQAFFRQNRSDYMWGERALIQTFTVQTEDPDQCRKVQQFVMANGAQKTIEKFNEDTVFVTYSKEKVEKGKTEQPISWQKRVAFDFKVEDEKCSFQYIADILPPENKQLKEARGFVISDYQAHLEKEWLQSLKDKYELKVNNEVLDNFIKEQSH